MAEETGGSQTTTVPSAVVRIVQRLRRSMGITTFRLPSHGTIRVLNVPSVFRPWLDSLLLAESLSTSIEPGMSVLDVCSGTGILAVAAARLGAADVVAVDVSKRAVHCLGLNAALNRVQVHRRCGDLFAVVDDGELFDVIVANPPWLPSASDTLPERGISRAWWAGRDGRALIDRVCAQAPGHLRAGGLLLMAQASFCDVPATVTALRRQGLAVDIVAERATRITIDGVGERAFELYHQGPWARDDAQFEVVVIGARRVQSDAPAPEAGDSSSVV